jgi:hypothetical protein
MEPSSSFTRYAVSKVLYEAQRLYPPPRDAVEQQLWAASLFDWFDQAGECVNATDALGVPMADARGYAIVIADAMRRYDRARLPIK